MMLAREPVLLEAWFLMKQMHPDSVVNVRQQTWSTWDMGRLWVVLNALRLVAEKEGTVVPLRELADFDGLAEKLG